MQNYSRLMWSKRALAKEGTAAHLAKGAAANDLDRLEIRAFDAAVLQLANSIVI